jgi:hypothetical protein
MPILGTIASSTRQGISTTSYESISTVSLTSGTQATIDFTSIPSTFKHLQLRCVARLSDGGGGFGGAKLMFNNDTVIGNYTYRRVIGNNDNASAYAQVDLEFTVRAALAGISTGIFSPSIVNIYDYSDSNKRTTMNNITGGDRNSTLENVIGLYGQMWNNTTTVNSIQLTPSQGSFAQYSHFALYGIKG